MNKYLKSKLHRATITGARLEYEGSITIDPVLMAAAGLEQYESVLVVVLQTGERFETYAVEGKPNSGEVVLNGGAARLGTVGDTVIVMAFTLSDSAPQPRIVRLDGDNRVVG